MQQVKIEKLLIDWLYDFYYREWENIRIVLTPDILHTRRIETSKVIDRNISAGNVLVMGESKACLNGNPNSGCLWGSYVLEKSLHTPQNNDKKGYATACVGHISKQIHSQGYHCILYSDLNNPVFKHNLSKNRFQCYSRDITIPF